MMSQFPSLLSSSFLVACESRDFEEGSVKPWVEKLNLVVQGHGAQQEGVSLSYRDRLGLTQGHHAVACHEGYLLLLVGVWNAYHTQTGNPQTC